jgi:hypothetical protein
MFLRFCYSWIKSAVATKRPCLTIYCVLVILLGWYPWNVLLIFAVIGVPRIELTIEGDRYHGVEDIH